MKDSQDDRWSTTKTIRHERTNALGVSMLQSSPIIPNGSVPQQFHTMNRLVLHSTFAFLAMNYSQDDRWSTANTIRHEGTNALGFLALYILTFTLGSIVLIILWRGLKNSKLRCWTMRSLNTSGDVHAGTSTSIRTFPIVADQDRLFTVNIQNICPNDHIAVDLPPTYEEAVSTQKLTESSSAPAAVSSSVPSV